MTPTIAFQWIEPCPSARLREAQVALKQSVLALGLEPALFSSGPSLIKFRDILEFARERSRGTSFVWCNSDVTLTGNPYEFEDARTVCGFHRREMPSGVWCGGVDMYLIPNSVWDEILSRGAPDMWCGATHIDWWLTNAAAIAGKYRSHYGFIEHLSHEPSGASKRRSNSFYRHNVKEYNKWALRNGATTFLERIDLPIVGESLSPMSDLWRRMRRQGSH